MRCRRCGSSPGAAASCDWAGGNRGSKPAKRSMSLPRPHTWCGRPGRRISMSSRSGGSPVVSSPSTVIEAVRPEPARDFLITAAYHTPNGPLHLGHLGGPFLGADVLGRHLETL